MLSKPLRWPGTILKALHVLTLLILKTILGGGYYYYLHFTHFTYEEMERLSNLSKVTEPAIGIARIWTQAAKIQSPSIY